jgi:hypothetical protein
MLKKTGGNLTRAAELAGVNRRFMQRLVARLGIRASEVIAEPEDLGEESGGDSGPPSNDPEALQRLAVPTVRPPARRRSKSPIS